jgi:twitching motility protein PilI
MGFSCGGQHFVVALNEIKEVIPLGNVTALPSSASWFLGVTNLRGHVLPVTDLEEFILDRPVQKSPLAKILVLDFEKLNVGFLVEQILGVQRFQKNKVTKVEDKQALDQISSLDARFIPYIQAVILESTTTWYVLSLKTLSQTPQFFHIVKEVGG